VRAAISDLGGRVTQVALHEEIGYNGIAAVVPVEALRDFVEQGPDAVRLLRTDDVFLVRPGGQSVLPTMEAVAGAPLLAGAPLPTGDPAVLLLDGLPVVNHARLDGRIVVFDPDGLDDGTYEARLRRHGTQMASLIAWGDLSEAGSPLSPNPPIGLG
jgi:hypothetical protein